jgi:hypothetical protein
LRERKIDRKKDRLRYVKIDGRKNRLRDRKIERRKETWNASKGNSPSWIKTFELGVIHPMFSSQDIFDKNIWLVNCTYLLVLDLSYDYWTLVHYSKRAQIKIKIIWFSNVFKMLDLTVQPESNERSKINTNNINGNLATKGSFPPPSINSPFLLDSDTVVTQTYFEQKL